MEKNTEALAKEEINAWLADTLQRQADVIITSDVRRVTDICQDPDRDEITVMAWTDFDEMSVGEFLDYIEELNSSGHGVWVEGHHPDGDRSDLFETYDGHVADDYALFFIHNLESIAS